MTRNEIANKILEALESDNEFSVFFWDDHAVEVKFRGPLRFTTMAKLALSLGTDLIDVGSDAEPGGCSTCDFGTESWVTLSIKEIP